MNLTDYKLWYVLRDSKGYILEATVRFFEGEIQEIEGDNIYVRTTRLQKEDLLHLGEIKTRKDSSGFETICYNQKHFGRIQNDDDLHSFLKAEIFKDKSREVIDELKLE